MAKRKLEPGFQAFGHVYGIANVVLPGHYEIDTGGKALLTILEVSGDLTSIVRKDTEVAAPELLQFRGLDLSAALSELRSIGRAINFSSRNTELRFTVGRTVATSADLSYEEVNGVSSTLEGFPGWAEVTAIEQSLILSNDRMEPPAVCLKAQAKDSVNIGTLFNVSVTTGFTAPKLDPYQLEYVYRNRTALRTETPELVTWNEHMQVHRMVQDLLCLVYNYPCELSLSDAYRKDDQQELDTASEEIYLWHEVHYENFGRTRHVEPCKDFSKVKPLFLLSDTADGAVATWLDEFEKWSRPTWIAVETIFQPYLAAESRMIQIAVALEALGYATWKYEENNGDDSTCGKAWCKGTHEKTNPCEKPGCNLPYATGYFRKIAETIPFADLDIAEEKKPDEWAKAFNQVYKGCKHADNPLPDGLEAHRRAEQGLAVIRCWMAKNLGVSNETLIENRDRLK